MQHVQRLAGLRHGGEQRPVAALALALRVVARRRAFRLPLRAQHRAVEVDRRAPRAQRPQPLDHQFPVRRPHLVDAAPVHAGERARDRRHVRQPPQAHRAPHRLVVAVARHVAQAAAAEQQVNHQQQDDGVRRVGALRQVPEARPQALLQPQPGEQPLEDDQPGVRGEALRLESDFQRPVRFSAHGVPAKLHFGGLLRCLFEHLHRTKGGRRFPDPQNDSASVFERTKGVVGAGPLRPTAGASERQRRKSALDPIGEDPNRTRRNAFVAPFLGARLLFSRFVSSGEPITTRRAAQSQGDRLRI